MCCDRLKQVVNEQYCSFKTGEGFAGRFALRAFVNCLLSFIIWAHVQEELHRFHQHLYNLHPHILSHHRRSCVL